MAFEEEWLKRIFNETDKNKSGKIDIEELQTDYFTNGEISRLTRKNFVQILSQYDSDKDNCITYDEFKAAIEQAERDFG
ncbi:MAG: EF-hand domain-containing protein [Nostoc sp. DedSLP03]|uniref:EF-hand domain-containing protein n=1 Tax=Nostoc sp. DedSLP03 TaxID=3075400 RepID=UPI002AD48A0C|nr:EF-hand domain-containing protein [Nostoc sp. DedSLP03]MDZ7966859.1 EF-hand domain-containing protein [Nostoc sp. DedSLP03]